MQLFYRIRGEGVCLERIRRNPWLLPSIRIQCVARLTPLAYVLCRCVSCGATRLVGQERLYGTDSRCLPEYQSIIFRHNRGSGSTTSVRLEFPLFIVCIRLALPAGRPPRHRRSFRKQRRQRLSAPCQPVTLALASRESSSMVPERRRRGLWRTGAGGRDRGEGRRPWIASSTLF